MRKPRWLRRKKTRVQKTRRHRRDRHGDRAEIVEDAFWAGAELGEPIWGRVLRGLGGFLDDLLP